MDYGLVVGQVVGDCQMTKEDLTDALRESQHGKDQRVFLCYFHEGMPPRCNNCSLPIGSHHSKPPVVPANQKQKAKVVAGQKKMQQNATPVAPFCSLCIARDEMSTAKEEDTTTTTTNSSAPSSFAMIRAANCQKHLSKKELQGDMQCGCCDSCGSWVTPPTISPSCDECGVQLFATNAMMSEAQRVAVKRQQEDNKDLVFYQCKNNTYTSPYRKGSKGYRRAIKFKCDRIVCSECVKRRHHETPNSRFHHQDPQWRVGLYGCLSSPTLCCSSCTCYWCCDHRSGMWEGNIDSFSRNKLHEYVTGVADGNCLFIPLFPILAPYMICQSVCLECGACTRLADPVVQMRRHELEVRARFGVPPHTDGEMSSCRPCIYNRLLREAEARGYPQPSCCTSRDNIPDIVGRYPPHPLSAHGIGAPPAHELL